MSSFATMVGAALRWFALVPVAVFAAFAVLVLSNNLADWLSGGWPGASPTSPFLYTVADFAWPLVFVVVGAAIAPAYHRAVAILFACVAIFSTFLIGGSWSLNWLSDVPVQFYGIGLGLTAAGAVAGIFAVMRLSKRSPAL